MSVQIRMSGIEEAVEMKGRRISVFREMNVADIVRNEIRLLKLNKLRWVGIDVGYCSIIDSEFVNLEWIDSFERSLPALLLQGDFARCL